MAAESRTYQTRIDPLRLKLAHMASSAMCVNLVGNNGNTQEVYYSPIGFNELPGGVVSSYGRFGDLGVGSCMIQVDESAIVSIPLVLDEE